MRLFHSVLKLLLLLALLILQGCESTSEQSQPKYAAFILGNSYNNSSQPALKLKNTVNDARLIASKLETLPTQFTSIMLIEDPSEKELNVAINKFLTGLDSNTTAFFFYAGHGIQINNQNYMLTSDGNSLVEFSDLLTTLRQHAYGVVAVLDACRNNPFGDGGVNTAANSRGLKMVKTSKKDWTSKQIPRPPSEWEKGLAKMQLSGSRMMVVFSTDPGNVATDSLSSTDTNSPFTEALGNAITNQTSFEEVINSVSSSLDDPTLGIRQAPWRQNSWTESLYFAGMPAVYSKGKKNLVPPM
ncbi:MAG: caspase family protein [Gammaproteobacteria bacterium]|nr:caspase family protein [Gammaproteobacteria bacterium]